MDDHNQCSAQLLYMADAWVLICKIYGWLSIFSDSVSITLVFHEWQEQTVWLLDAWP